MSNDPFNFSAGGDAPSRRSLRKLAFTQRIVPLTGSKAIATSELANRLKKLHTDLSKIEQDDVDTQTLMGVQKDLKSPSLLSHKDKAVKILTACCLADILRLFAPDAPYNQKELRDIFEFFVKQLQYIGDKDGPYYTFYYYLLDSLSTVKSVVLVADLNAEDLIIEFFRVFFDLSKQDLPKNVTMCMVDILQQLVDECHHLPQEVVDMILSYFQQKKQTERPNAFRMAADLCNASPEKLQRYVCQYFSDAIVAAGRGFDEENDEKEFESAHKLILEINRVAPAVLLNVIPQLDEELKLDDANVRTLATDVLGEMFSEPGSKLAEKYPHVWKSWLGRRLDKQVSVRLAWLEWGLPIFKNHPELSHEVELNLKDKCTDPDERVRAALLKMIGQLDALSAHNVTKDLLIAAGARLRDKKSHVREAATEALGRIFNMKYPEIVDSSAGEPVAADKYGWIPGQIIDTLYMDDPETKVFVEKALHDYIFPPIPDDTLRTERLLNIISFWTEKQKKAFVNVLDRQSKTIQATAAFLDQCEKYNGGIMDADEEQTEKLLLQIVQYLAARFPDPKKAQVGLQKFAKANDGRVYKLMRSIMDPQADYKPIIKNIREVIKRLEQRAGLMEIFVILLRRISLTLVPKSSIPCLIEKIRTSKRAQDKHVVKIGETAERLVKDISIVFPALYRSHLDQFSQLLQSSDDGLVADSLEALARFTKTFPEEAPQDSESQENLMKFVLEGTPRQAKNAVVVLAHMRGGEDSCNAVLGSILGSLSFHNERLITHLAALAQLARDASANFEAHYATVTNFIVKDLLLVNRRKAKDDDVDWIEYQELEREGQLKVMGIRILTKRLLALADEGHSDAATPVLKLLRRLLEFDGEIVADKNTPPAFQTHLRLVAAISFLKLARCPAYAGMITVSDVHKLALSIQDPIYQVRNAFVEKLMLYLSEKSVPFDYMTILFLGAHEPETELKLKIKNFLMRKAKQQRTEETGQASLLENIIVRFLHLLSHHPDFSVEVEDIQMFAMYIDFFLDAVATSENASFLYYMCAKLKTYRDLHAKNSENVYVLSDLAQFLIQEKSNHTGWSLPSYPGNVHLPKDLFGKLPSQTGAENARKSYLPQDFLDMRSKAHEKVKPAKKEPRIKQEQQRSRSATPLSEEEGSITGTKRKAKRARAPASAKKRRKSREANGDEGSEGDLPAETPQRKNAPRSARKVQSFKEASDEDEDEEDNVTDDAGDSEREDRMEVDEGVSPLGRKEATASDSPRKGIKKQDVRDEKLGIKRTGKIGGGKPPAKERQPEVPSDAEDTGIQSDDTGRKEMQRKRTRKLNGDPMDLDHHEQQGASDVQTPRKRGRPKKDAGLVERGESKTDAATTKAKRRGRPPKKGLVEEDPVGEEADEADSQEDVPKPTAAKRGRPRKVAAVEDVDIDEEQQAVAAKPTRRGRLANKDKMDIDDDEDQQHEDDVEATRAPAKRGRPGKKPVTVGVDIVHDKQQSEKGADKPARKGRAKANISVVDSIENEEELAKSPKGGRPKKSQVKEVTRAKRTTRGKREPPKKNDSGIVASDDIGEESAEEELMVRRPTRRIQL